MVVLAKGTASMDPVSYTHLGWVAKPAKIGTPAVITVMAKQADGRTTKMAETSLRVRALPDPLPYIPVSYTHLDVYKRQ